MDLESFNSLSLTLNGLHFPNQFFLISKLIRIWNMWFVFCSIVRVFVFLVNSQGSNHKTLIGRYLVMLKFDYVTFYIAFNGLKSSS